MYVSKKGLDDVKKSRMGFLTILAVLKQVLNRVELIEYGSKEQLIEGNTTVEIS